jgi:DNA repair exonuclease SbcCD ATPase subunit
MYINKLYLRAFGKFLYKRIYLGKKFNIIYGENETGKSTIHNFIEAMLYGFGEDSKGNELQLKYKPWNSDLYKGSISIDNFKGRKYTVSRDFLIGTTQVFNKHLDDNKGQASTEEEIRSPGEYFLNISKVSYRNTISIKQLGNKTDKELSAELKNKIINLSNSKDESISISRILSALNNIKDEAGSEDNPKTLLGQYALRLEALEKSKEATINVNRQVMFLAMEKKKINSKIQEIDDLILKMNRELEEYELSVEKDKYLRAKPLKEELEELKEKLNAYDEKDKTQNYNSDDYIEAVKLCTSLNYAKDKRHDLLSKKEEAERALKALIEDISNNIDDNFDIEKMNSNFSSYESNNTKIENMSAKIEAGEKTIESFDTDEINKFTESNKELEETNSKLSLINTLLNNKSYESMKAFAKSQKNKGTLLTALGLLCILIAGACAYGAYYYNIQEYYYGSGTSVIGIMFFILAHKPKIKSLNAGKEIESMECQHADYLKNIDVLSIKSDEIIKGCNSADYDDFKQKYENIIKQQNILLEKTNLLQYDKSVLDDLINDNKETENKLLKDFSVFLIDEITSDNLKKANEIYERKNKVKEDVINYKNLLNEINQSLNKMDKEISYEDRRLNMILNSNSMKSMEEFKIRVDSYNNYIELKNKKENCENYLETILGQSDFEELKLKTEKLNLYEAKEIDKKEQQLAIFKRNEEKNKLLININNIDKEIIEIENSVRNSAEIEEEIEFYEDKKNQFNERIQVADIAAEKIVEISDSIKGDFMPLLKESISENFAYITDGKYEEVNIDDDMNITVTREDNKEKLIEIESLSGGTLDQLYLSLRIGLSNILSGNQNIPIILDDSFVQYDSNRLKKSIEMLARESERRQIILFTCQEREVEYAKQLNVKFNLIKL